MGRPKKIKIPVIIRTFDECYPEILKIIESRKFRWQLSAIHWLSWEDIRQNLLKHLWLKWHLYNQEKPLHSWVMVVVNNQMINMIRNYYGNYAKPCLKCEFYDGGDLCAKFGTCNSKCELYRAWTYGKKTKHDIQLPLPMENCLTECQEIQTTDLDIDKSADNIHNRMKQILKPLEWVIYYNLFVLHKSEEEVGKLLKFKSSEKNRVPGYARLSQFRKIILQKVKQELNAGNIEIIAN